MRNIAFATLLLILVCAGAGLGLSYQQVMTAPVILTEPVTVDIEKGDSLNEIADKLAMQDLAVSALWFKLIALQKQVAKQLKTGEYELPIGLTLPEIIDVFVQGKTKHYSITFVEGWRFQELLQVVQSNPHLIHTLDSPDAIDSFLHSLTSEQSNPEGLFFPDTYFFSKTDSDTTLLSRAYEKMRSILADEWQQKADNLPLQTPYQALILASIIEKETAASHERPQISGVFSRRLQRDMLLQTDPTVIYGMGANYHGNIHAQDLITPTPYNTYTNKGLPPTPIAMPSRAAINAALHPAAGDSLYFVAKGDGTHSFSSSLSQHNQAVNQFQLAPKIQEENPVLVKPITKTKSIKKTAKHLKAHHKRHKK
jgi:UPF0755 protein